MSCLFLLIYLKISLPGFLLPSAVLFSRNQSYEATMDTTNTTVSTPPTARVFVQNYYSPDLQKLTYFYIMESDIDATIKGYLAKLKSTLTIDDCEFSYPVKDATREFLGLFRISQKKGVPTEKRVHLKTGFPLNMVITKVYTITEVDSWHY